MGPEKTRITYKHLWAQLWALVSYLRFLNVQLHIEFLHKLLILYAIHEVINPENKGSWSWEKAFSCGNFDAKSYFKMFDSMKFSFYSKIFGFILSGNSNRSNWFLSFFFIYHIYSFNFLGQGAFFHFTQITETRTSSENALQLNVIRQKWSFHLWVQRQLTQFQLWARAFLESSCNAFHLWESWAVVSLLCGGQPGKQKYQCF